MNVPEMDFKMPVGLNGFLRGVTLAGALIVAAGLMWAPQRTWSSLLLAGYFLVCLGLAGVFFVATHYAAGAAWHVAFRRVPEAMTAILPYGAGILAAVFLFGSSLYPWTAEKAHGGFQAMWLNLPFFLSRAALYLTLWFLFARAIVRRSRLQDVTRAAMDTQKNARTSILFLVVFAVTFWLASFDWLMSLTPHWYSTIFGIYNFAGMFSSGLAVMILLVIWMRRAGPLRDFVNQEHLHDLGKLLFAFSTFWMYIWFSQYMLVWYANIPEETVYYVQRQHGFWLPLFILNFLLNWVVPFVVLLPTRTKRDAGILGKAALIVLLGRWLDIYLMTQPMSSGSAPRFGLWEIGAFTGACSLFVLIFLRAMRRALPVPMGDPMLAESLHYHN
ncbi:MAG: hypothetical protein HY820_23265 [Acidobacteria bacterium]|nr:hypothetical protein [Acidobacteriota bacterium]